MFDRFLIVSWADEYVADKAKEQTSEGECYKKTKHTKFSEKRAFLTPWYAHVPVCIRG